MLLSGQKSSKDPILYFYKHIDGQLLRDYRYNFQLKMLPRNTVIVYALTSVTFTTLNLSYAIGPVSAISLSYITGREYAAPILRLHIIMTLYICCLLGNKPK